MSKSFYSWSFTLNNYDEEEYASLISSIQETCEYGVVGREVGELGTKHLQGYCRFKDRVVFKTAKGRLNTRCHIEKSAGSAEQNRVYCVKDGSYWEFGSCPKSSGGQSSRELVSRCFVDAVDNSGREGMVRFAAEQPGSWYYSGHNLLRNYLCIQQPVHRPDIEVSWFHGEPGTGKSRRAHELLPTAYIKDPRTKWWDGYLLEKDVIIDDFGPQGIDINHLLRWFDRYKCNVEAKGLMVPLFATKFIVTSNFLPSTVFRVLKYRHLSDELYEDHPQLPALMRRIKLISFPYIYT